LFLLNYLLLDVSLAACCTGALHVLAMSACVCA